MARPKGLDPATLARHNVTKTETATEGLETLITLTCGVCEASWPVMWDPKAGRVPAGYWECPNGCNLPITPDPDHEHDPEAAPKIPTDLDALPAILTPAEAALLLRVSETTVKDWARAGELPGAFKLGKEWRVETRALLAYIRGAA